MSDYKDKERSYTRMTSYIWVVTDPV